MVGDKVTHVRNGGYYSLTKFQLNDDGIVMAELEGMEAVDPDLYKPLEEEDYFRLRYIQNERLKEKANKIYTEIALRW